MFAVTNSRDNINQPAWVWLACLGLSFTVALCTGTLYAEDGADTMEQLPIIDSLWDYNDPALSESRFREVIARAREANDPFYEMEATTQLTRSLGMQRKFEQAQATLDESKGRMTPEMTVANIRWQLEQGRVLNSSGKPQASIPFFEEALDLANAAKAEYLAIDAAHMLGIVEEPERAISWNEKAMTMAESAEDPAARRWLGPLYNNLAWTYHDLGEYEKALSLFTKDIALRESMEQPFEASIARWSMANTLRHLGRVEEALEIQMALSEHPLRQDNNAEGYTHEEIGECLLLLGREDEARPHFRIAYERLSTDPWLQANEKDRLERLRQKMAPE